MVKKYQTDYGPASNTQRDDDAPRREPDPNIQSCMKS